LNPREFQGLKCRLKVPLFWEIIGLMADQKLNTLSKGLQVIQKFVFEKETWGPREIARALGISKSTALRLLQTLHDRRFLILNEKGHKYTIGPELWRIGEGQKNQINFTTIAGHVISKYVQNINETMYFFTHDHGKVIFETVVECTHDLCFRLKIGIPYEPQRGVAGKIILAFLPSEKRDEILKKLKKDPTVDLKELRRKVEQAKTKGYSFTLGERVEGVVGFAAPILGPQKVLLGGIGLTIPKARYKAKDHKKYANLVKSCARELSFAANPGSAG
jgi:DNA-binding IclR family transcriptional regulator